MKACAAATAILRPVAMLPVKTMASLLATTAWPVSAAPRTSVMMPASSGTSSMERCKGSTKRGVTSLGLIMTAAPATSAGIASMNDSTRGKFQGLMTPTSG